MGSNALRNGYAMSACAWSLSTLLASMCQNATQSSCAIPHLPQYGHRLRKLTQLPSVLRQTATDTQCVSIHNYAELHEGHLA